jgi:hypothetical protein
VIAFVFIALYTLFLITGGDVQVQERPSSLHQGGNGYFLFYKLFQQLGYQMRRWYEAELPKKGGCLLYLDYFFRDRHRETIDKIVKWVKEGNTLFLVGVKANTDSVFYRRVNSGPAQDIKISKEVTSGSFKFSFSYSRYVEPKTDDVVLMRSESGALLIRRPMGDGWVYLFADNNLFVNRYFFNPHHAMFLNEVLRKYYRGKFYLYEYGTRISIYKVNNPVTVLFKGDFLFVTLHLFLLGMIFAAWKARRFGKPLQAEPFRRRSISVHLAAVGGFYQKTRAYTIVETLTRKYFIYRAKHLLNIKKNISTGDLAEMLVKYTHTGKGIDQIKMLLEESTGIHERMLVKKRKDIHELIMEIQDYKK